MRIPCSEQVRPFGNVSLGFLRFLDGSPETAMCRTDPVICLVGEQVSGYRVIRESVIELSPVSIWFSCSLSDACRGGSFPIGRASVPYRPKDAFLIGRWFVPVRPLVRYLSTGRNPADSLSPMVSRGSESAFRRVPVGRVNAVRGLSAYWERPLPDCASPMPR